MVCIEAIADIIISHPSLLAPIPAPANADTTTTSDAPSPQPNLLAKAVTKALIKAFNWSLPELSTAGCLAASKLLLADTLPQAHAAELLKMLTVAYFDPDTRADAALQQTLSYCVPVFCHSRPKNALLMARVAIPVIQKLYLLRDGLLDDDGDTMVSWTVIANHLSEWTDGRRCFRGGNPDTSTGDRKSTRLNSSHWE